MRACFTNAGQLCISIERLYVHERSTTRSPSASSDRAQNMRLGAGLDYERRHGLADLPAPARRGHRATSTTPSRRAPRCSPAAGPAPTSARYFYEPTVLAGVTSDMELCRRRDLRPGRVASTGSPPTTRPSSWPTTPTTGSTPASGPATVARGRARRRPDQGRHGQRQRGLRRGVRHRRRAHGRHEALRRRPPARRRGPAQVHRGPDRSPASAGSASSPSRRDALREVRRRC